MNKLATRFIAFIGASLLLIGCITPYQKNGIRGGWDDTQKSPFTFGIKYNVNGYTSTERAMEYAIMRAAELALENGFDYFALLNEERTIDYRDLLDELNKNYWKPIVTIYTTCYRMEPKHFRHYYKAEEIFATLGQKYGVSRSPMKGTFEEQPQLVQFMQIEAYQDIPRQGAATPVPIAAADKLSDISFPIAFFAEYDNPVKDIESFTRVALDQSKEIPATHLQIFHGREAIDNSNYAGALPRELTFLAVLHYEPSKNLGVELERGRYKVNEIIVRRKLNELAALMPNDKIIGANGKEIKTVEDFFNVAARWNSQSEVELTIIRNGEEQKITTKLFNLALNPAEQS